jgi:hypothetical protein
MSITRRRSTNIVLVFLLMPVLSISLFHGLQPGPTMLLSAHDLAGIFGAGFWSDPCTWDGFGAGITGVLCGTGNIGACGGAVLAIWKAIKLDNCFS